MSLVTNHRAEDQGALIIDRLLPVISAFTNTSNILHDTQLQGIDGEGLRMVYEEPEGLH